MTLNSKKELITFDNYKGENLGIKVVLASNKKTNQYFAVITDVNPASYCSPEKIATGDILISINGIEINNMDNLNNFLRLVSEGKMSMLEITIIRKGALDRSDLLKRCMNSPCSETCELWNENEPKVTRKEKVPETHILSSETPLYTLKYNKTVSVDDILANKSQKIPNTTSEEPVLLSSKLTAAYNKPTITYHQKALPMTNKKKPSTAIIIRKSNQNSDKDMIASPLPHFIKRPSARQYDNIKPAKSLNNLSDNHYDHNSSSSSETTSSSSESSPTPIFTPRKISLPSVDIPSKPTPMPRTKHINLVHTISIESRDFRSLAQSFDDQHRPHRPSNVDPKQSSKRSNNMIIDKKTERIRNTNHQTIKSGDLNNNYSSMPPFGSTNSYRS